ncbi:hypothetical protein TRFO_22692 [Tritrichomonas foetus]|uniref:PRA1 family protein n=1 Tax=Tritrichomonas foetus TaxID=1144522 RepID=A0A1J4KCS0_9EUKA|nr:hypothetical protein TRFO_22692 [Tritrichomonas foetus]|eukprot:OHT08770.1 hypothetical protein TRFO_22692 [Tritrichomonas foetus]
MSQLSISFEGATWNLKQETYDTIIKYAALLEDVPQLNTFVNGFLLNDYLTSFKSFFWAYLFFFTLMSMNKAFALVFFSFFFFCVTLFVSKPDKNYPLVKSSPFLRTALLLYFTYHRIEVYMSWRKAYLVFTLCLFVFIAFPTFLSAMMFPIIFSSLLVRTEMLVNYMRIM